MYKYLLLLILAGCTNTTQIIIPDTQYPVKPIPANARIDSVVMVYGEGEKGSLFFDKHAICISDTSNGDFKILEYRLKNNKVIDTNSFVWLYEIKCDSLVNN